MTATTTERDTKKMDLDVIPSRYTFPVKADEIILAGTIVVLDAGYARAGAEDTGLVSLWRADEDVDATGLNDGDLTVDCELGVFAWANGDSIAQADVGGACYVADNQTVTKDDNSAARSAAGRVMKVDADGVWVLPAIIANT